MNQEDFLNAYILLLSGAAELKGKAVKWKDKYDDDIYIEFPDLIPTRAIVREYWDNGNESWEHEYKNGIRYGISTTWDGDGTLFCEFIVS